MIISLHGVQPRDERAADHLVRLFFDDPDVRFDGTGEPHAEPPDLQLELHVEEKGEVCAEARLVRLSDGKAWAARRKRLPGAGTDEDRQHFVKQTMLQALLKVLEDFTGLRQPWGILTGIRPVKLMHRKKQQGLSTGKIREQIREETMVSDEKIRLMEQIVERQLRAVPDLYGLKREVSLYIGIPFCPTKCAYCTFPAYAIGSKQGEVAPFLHGLHGELSEVGRWLKENGVRVTTVYFGGGTPTSISAEDLDRLLEAMHRALPDPDHIREITVEAGRPDTITPEKLKVLRSWNIDRISINPQTYTQATLKAIGRHHTVEETIEKFWLARDMGMRNINMDLIVGLPGEGLPHIEHSLEQTGRLMPESLTVHTLSFKRASEMTQHRDRYTVASREEASAMMRRVAEWTARHGYGPYYLYRQKNILGNLENIGYALPGKESIYNIMIMEEMQTIIGIGCGASSKWVDPETGAIVRTANPKEPKAYNESWERCTETKLEWLDRLFGMPATLR